MKKSDFFYDLPEELIAYYPDKERKRSRLLLLSKSEGTFTDTFFYDIGKYLFSGDVLVLNNTKVIPARLVGNRQTGGKAEVFLIKDKGGDIWEVLAKPSARLKKGEVIKFGDKLQAEFIDFPGGKLRTVRLRYSGGLFECLEEEGQVPLPPYIKREAEEEDKIYYQTVYADNYGAVAAPTAGLHFTEDILDELADNGIEILFITLHVGYGTFSPVEVEDLREHKMHAEYFEISDYTAERINLAKMSGKRIVACGTTVVRALESNSDGARVFPSRGETNIFIYPPYRFKIVDALVTNFHLPESSLIMLVSAFCGKELLFSAYAHAVKEKYSFFSYGDAMLIY